MDAAIQPEGTPRRLYFDATLTPYRSLPPAGFHILMGAVGGVSLTMGVLFLVSGAWPVFGFLGLDVALLYFAFRLNYRSALAREVLRLDDAEMAVERFSPSGHARRWSFQPAWLQVRHDRASEYPSPLVLASHGRSLEIGSFLGQKERTDLADALVAALARQRLPAHLR
ncbi:MAG: DUF2244 domain-containing protein [Alphaproteobacteria bacterium]|nr:DUF2244 domain-containing protein [Alphaproteobacteria bacterium]MBU0796590.1 DUF2244 domain-containing protein [Alphaproteobacteria bacterium]MBU0886341.1 DUF2244 domain-containing protein [Alphaproteobacteria bacterium]MBU1813463.1 DUF2244 domain-containing protein [Alphaproteobacteria bacterium]